ncbi:MAG: ATP-dependent Clp protease proteolytic subunit [Gemmatimonadota bacterium]|nr:ATP-dependent Clp protease proteolytic subunit [Gemmatimonadota bacterium]
MALVPMVLEKTGLGERSYDIFSRLLRDNIIFIGFPINDTIANLVIAQMLFCSSESPEKTIRLYINSPGGSITAGLAIYDTMQYVPNEVETVCVGQAFSIAAVLLAGGTKGQRRALPNSRILVHQPMGGAGGQASDVERHAREILQWRDRLNEILAEQTGQPIERVAKDADRDFFMSAAEAMAYGVIDEVLAPSKEDSLVIEDDA